MYESVLFFHVTSGVISLVWVARLYFAKAKNDALLKTNLAMAATTTSSGIGLLALGASLGRVCPVLGVYLVIVASVAYRYKKEVAQIKS